MVYWYDALGRRVLKRSRQESPLCTFNGTDDRCYSSMERYVWDGDQLLWELRSSSTNDQDPSGGDQTGHSGYVLASGIDAPIGMVRNDTTAVLHRGWRGAYVAGTGVAALEEWDRQLKEDFSLMGCAAATTHLMAMGMLDGYTVASGVAVGGAILKGAGAAVRSTVGALLGSGVEQRIAGATMANAVEVGGTAAYVGAPHMRPRGLRRSGPPTPPRRSRSSRAWPGAP